MKTTAASDAIPNERIRPLMGYEIANLPGRVREIVLHERFKRLYPERFNGESEAANGNGGANE